MNCGGDKSTEGGGERWRDAGDIRVDAGIKRRVNVAGRFVGIDRREGKILYLIGYNDYATAQIIF